MPATPTLEDLAQIIRRVTDNHRPNQAAELSSHQEPLLLDGREFRWVNAAFVSVLLWLGRPD